MKPFLEKNIRKCCRRQRRFILREGPFGDGSCWVLGDIIEDWILMEADIDAGRHKTALGAAVDRVLVYLLIKHGASPRKCAESGVSPLKAAVINADDDMMRLLVSNGTDPANNGAFF